MNKTLSKLQIILSLAAIFLSAVLAFCPILSVPLHANAPLGTAFTRVLRVAAEKEMAEASAGEQDAIAQKYASINASLADDSGDASVAMSGVRFLANLPATVEFIGAWITSNSIENMEESIAARRLADPSYAESGLYVADLLELQQLQTKLEEIDPAAVNEVTVSNVRIILTGFISVTMENDFTDGANTIWQMLAVLAVTVAKLAALAVMLIGFPIVMVIAIIRLLPACIASRGQLDMLYASVMHGSQSVFGWLGMILAVLTIWSARFTAAGWLLTIAVAAVLIINIVVSREKKYTPNEKKYLNRMQLCAVISIVGIVLFAISLSKADLIGFYISSDAGVQIALTAQSAEEYLTAMCVIAALAAITAIVLVYVFKGVMGLLSRVACMSDAADDATMDKSMNAISSGGLLILANIIVRNIYDLSLPAEQKTAFNLACAGILIALAGEILQIVLSTKTIPGLTDEEIRAVRCGGSVADAPKQEKKADGESPEEQEIQ